jgi:hypothetical protein
VNATGKENEVLLDENLVECKVFPIITHTHTHTHTHSPVSCFTHLDFCCTVVPLTTLLPSAFIIVMYQSPLFLRAHSKEILRGSLHNDTLFLSRLNVMDYSLLVGIDETSQELVVGIVGKYM